MKHTAFVLQSLLHPGAMIDLSIVLLELLKLLPRD